MLTEGCYRHHHRHRHLYQDSQRANPYHPSPGRDHISVVQTRLRVIGTYPNNEHGLGAVLCESLQKVGNTIIVGLFICTTEATALAAILLYSRKDREITRTYR